MQKRKQYTFEEVAKHNKPYGFDSLGLDWYLESTDEQSNYDENNYYDTDNIIAAYVEANKVLHYDDENHTPIVQLIAYIISDEDESERIYAEYHRGEPLSDYQYHKYYNHSGWEDYKVNNEEEEDLWVEFKPLLSIKGANSTSEGSAATNAVSVKTKKEN